jgi:dTMP kinase
MVIRSNFITVEGTDGSGKSTTAKYMGQYLTEKGIDNVVVDSYPRDEDSLFKRDLWIQKKIPDIAIMACILELRIRVLKDTIIPALLAGKIVVSDRWHDTTWAYQHYGLGIHKPTMDALFKEMFDLDVFTCQYPPAVQEWLIEQIECYRTVFLDVDVETSRKRVSGRQVAKDAFEQLDDMFFLNVAGGFKQRWRDRNLARNMLFTIDGRMSMEWVQRQVRTILDFQVPQVPPVLR